LYGSNGRDEFIFFAWFLSAAQTTGPVLPRGQKTTCTSGEYRTMEASKDGGAGNKNAQQLEEEKEDKTQIGTS